MRYRVAALIASLAIVLPALPGHAACRPFCAGGGLVGGTNLHLPLSPASFEWPLTFTGAVAGVEESPRIANAAARLHGVVEQTTTASVSGYGTITVFRDQGPGDLFAVPVRFNAAVAPGASGTAAAPLRGTVTQAAVGSGYGASIVLANGDLHGAIHAPRVLEEQSPAVVTTISAPGLYVQGESTTVSGSVQTVTGTRLPGIPVDVLVGGDYVRRVSTDQQGRWAATLALSDPDTHRVEAVALRESPSPVWSQPAHVASGKRLTVSTSGSGTVSSSPAGINFCSGGCSGVFAAGTQVSLTATPAQSSNFAGWSGACSGTGTCSVSMSQNRSAIAAFVLKMQTLTVSKVGTGAGAVSGPGISCGATCASTYTYGTEVTMTATPDTSSVFSGWSGACAGTGTCVLNMTDDRSVSAAFTLKSHLLSVSRSGNGSGTVTSTPGGISCGAACSANYSHGTSVGLSATAGQYSVFSGWSGACSGTGACAVSMTTPRSVAASFSLINADVAESEPNDTIASADPVAGTGVVVGSMPVGDVDMFTVTLGSWTAITAETFDPSLSSCASIDTVMRLLTSAGAEITSDDDSGIALCSRFTRAVAPGTYIVELTPYGSTSVAEYRLKLGSVALSAAYEPNDTIGTAAPVGFPGSLHAALSPVGDKDHYSFTNPSPQTLLLETFGPDGSTCPAIDTVLTLYTDAGAPVASDDDGGPGLCSRLEITVAAGNYRVGVEEFGNNGIIEAYTLELSGFHE